MAGMSTSAFQTPAVADSMHDSVHSASSDSPTSPPFSPVTPVMLNEFPTQGSQYQVASQGTEGPPLQPPSESDNPDAIALRSAIRMLQIQRQRAQQDMIALEKQKQLAAADPQAFAEALRTNQIKEQSVKLVFSQASLQTIIDDVQNEIDEQAKLDTMQADLDPKEVTSDSETGEKTPRSKFCDIPGPQEIVRCPPINWAKYHVLGQPLDILHQEQRRRPVDGNRIGEAHVRGEEHVIAAAYNPFKDQLAPRLSKTAPGNTEGRG
ncbi:MAG: hypothetical protein Q9204_003301 [Flavoplaca sp. TL-2023a]